MTGVNPYREQAGPLDEWAADEVISAARTLVRHLTSGQVRRLREGHAYTVHVDASTMRRILDVIEPVGEPT